MKILRYPQSTEACVLVLGTFDGVHRGHQALLMAAHGLAESYQVPLNVCTFSPHPLQVLRPEAVPPMLTTLPERAQCMHSFGVDNFCIIPFDRTMADSEPEAFLQSIAAVYRPLAIVVGYNYTFGAMGKGDTDFLKAWGATHGVEIMVVPNVRLDGDTVCSTRIRKLIREGDVQEAARLLGNSYTLSGEVENGKRVGRTIGFPTANVHVNQKKALPAYGVYSCWLQCDGGFFPSVVNVGRHPTLPEGSVTVEAHILGEYIMLYGKHVRLYFLKYQRPEQRFASVEELKAQITQDAADANTFFENLM